MQITRGAAVTAMPVNSPSGNKMLTPPTPTLVVLVILREPIKSDGASGSNSWMKRLTRPWGGIWIVPLEMNFPPKSMSDRYTVVVSVLEGLTMEYPLLRFGLRTAKPLNFRACDIAAI